MGVMATRFRRSRRWVRYRVALALSLRRIGDLEGGLHTAVPKQSYVPASAMSLHPVSRFVVVGSMHRFRDDVVSVGVADWRRDEARVLVRSFVAFPRRTR